jgi:hypothetical protein
MKLTNLRLSLTHRTAVIKQKVTHVKELTKIPDPPKTGKASKKPSPKGGRKTSATNGTKTHAGRGAARLRNSVNTTVCEESDRIARAPVHKTCDRNRTGARILVELQKAGPEAQTKKKRGPQPWVTQICSEPEWEGPWDDEDTRRDASKLLPSEPDLPAE